MRSLEVCSPERHQPPLVPGAAASVVDDLEAFVHEDLDLFLLGDDVHFPELGVVAQPAEDGGDAGHILGLADFDEGLRRRGDALADESGAIGVVADLAGRLGFRRRFHSFLLF